MLIVSDHDIVRLLRHSRFAFTSDITKPSMSLSYFPLKYTIAQIIPYFGKQTLGMTLDLALNKTLISTPAANSSVILLVQNWRQMVSNKPSL